MRETALRGISYSEIKVSLTVGHNKQEGAALQRGADSALTMSGQPAYHKRPVLSHHLRCICIRGSHLVGSSRTSKRRNRYAKARYSSQYARLRDVLIIHSSGKYFRLGAYFMPKQLRGPLEKTTSQLPKVLDSG